MYQWAKSIVFFVPTPDPSTLSSSISFHAPLLISFHFECLLSELTNTHFPASQLCLRAKTSYCRWQFNPEIVRHKILCFVMELLLLVCSKPSQIQHHPFFLPPSVSFVSLRHDHVTLFGIASFPETSVLTIWHSHDSLTQLNSPVDVWTQQLVTNKLSAFTALTAAPLHTHSFWVFLGKIPLPNLTCQYNDNNCCKKMRGFFPPMEYNAATGGVALV